MIVDVGFPFERPFILEGVTACNVSRLPPNGLLEETLGADDGTVGRLS